MNDFVGGYIEKCEIPKTTEGITSELRDFVSLQ